MTAPHCPLGYPIISVPDTGPVHMPALVAQACDVSQSLARSWLATGAVRVDGQVRRHMKVDADTVRGAVLTIGLRRFRLVAASSVDRWDWANARATPRPVPLRGYARIPVTPIPSADDPLADALAQIGAAWLRAVQRTGRAMVPIYTHWLRHRRRLDLLRDPVSDRPAHGGYPDARPRHGWRDLGRVKGNIVIHRNVDTTSGFPGGLPPGVGAAAAQVLAMRERGMHR